MDTSDMNFSFPVLIHQMCQILYYNCFRNGIINDTIGCVPMFLSLFTIHSMSTYLVSTYVYKVPYGHMPYAHFWHHIMIQSGHLMI